MLPSLSSFFFRQLSSELNEYNYSKLCHMLGNEPDLKIHFQNLGLRPHKNWGRKSTSFERFSIISSTVNRPAFKTKRHQKCLTSKRRLKLQKFPYLSQNFVDSGLQTPKIYRTCIFTHPPQILHSVSLPAFAHGRQQTELNQTLRHAGKRAK